MFQQFDLVLMLDHACNLRCTYCYTGNKFSRPMDQTTAQCAIDCAIRSTAPGGRLELGFFGGESLIHAALINSLIDYAFDAARPGGVRVEPGLTTNGTITTKPAWSVMTRPELRLAISHDGLPRIHDRHRIAFKIGGTSAIVEKTMAQLGDAGKPFSVIMVVRPDSLDDLPAGIEHLQRLGVREIQPSLDLWAKWSPQDIARLEAVVMRCAKIWRDGLPLHSINWFDEKAAHILKVPMQQTARCGFGAGQIAVAPSGRLYPCERLIGEDGSDNPSWLGTTIEQCADFTSIPNPPGRDHEECNACDMRGQCSTDCRCSNFVRTGDATKPDQLLCAWNQACLAATAEMLAEMSQSQNGEVHDSTHERAHIPASTIG